MPDFRSPQEVINGWFIEFHIDKITQVLSLKKAT
jgi:hypothetical protein